MSSTQTNYLTHDDVFDTDTEAYRKMMAIVESNQHLPKEVVPGRELHHIIERNFSKMSKAKIDNRSENLVSLSKTDHLLIHIYAFGCAKKPYRRGAARAVTMMRKYLLCGDISKNEFIMELLAESKELSDKGVKERLDRARKHRKGSFTMSFLDGIMAQVLSRVSRSIRVADLYNKIGIIGKTHRLDRYIKNALRDIPNGAPNDISDVLTEPLSKIMQMVFGDVLKTTRVNSGVIENNMRAYIFLFWYISVYHREEYDENDSLEQMLDKFADDMADIEYEIYIESLEPLRDIHGKWYTDGCTSGRFIRNPDPEFWRPGRPVEDDINGTYK